MNPKIRTGYSFRHAAGNIGDVLDRLQQVGATIAPITDRNSTFGFAPWAKECKKRGLRPVFGVELAVSPDPSAKKPVFDYWTFYASENMREINRLIMLATSQFRYQPLLTYEQAISFAEHSPVITGDRPLIDHVSHWPDNLYIGLSPATPVAIVRKAIKENYRIAAIGDNRYVQESDATFYETLAGRNAELNAYPQHILSEDEWRASIAHHDLPQETIGAALAASQGILDVCRAQPIKADLPDPPRPAPLREICERGAAKLGIDLADPVYAARLEKELQIIHAKGFDDYFYIVFDLVDWAKNRRRMAVGPARGSSCGSLVCYLLGITSVDPIPFGLLFERFIDINRMDNPDIDIDFSDQYRDEVFAYMAETYGTEHVARLGTVNMFQAKSALDETAGALRLPKWETEKVKEVLVERPKGDPREHNSLEDTFDTVGPAQKFIRDNPGFRIAQRLEGHPRHSGQHAAGVVLSRQPILDIVAVDFRVEDKKATAVGTTMCDKDDAEKDLGLLKIDALGLKELSVLEDCVELIGRRWGYLETLKLDDQAAFEILNNRNFNGIFQWGPAVQQLSTQIAITEFNDIVALNALARPGPLKSGSAQEWIDRHNGKPVSYPHPAFEPMLKETKGVIVYQEQVMHIARQIGRMSWERVTDLRKAISKSKGRAALAEFEMEFMQGCRETGVPDEISSKIWSEMLEHGAYSFNKSHAVAYAMVAYWGCWLKAHHPFEFAAASLTHRTDEASQIAMLREMQAIGLDYIPVDPEHSQAKWSVLNRGNGKVLLGPLTSIKGLGPKTLQEILSYRKRPNVEKLSARTQKLLSNPKTSIDSLSPIMDRIDVLHPDKLASGLRSIPREIGSITEEEDGPIVIWARLKSMRETDENSEDRVERRGYKHTEGPLKGLSMVFEDDTGEIFVKIDRKKFQAAAPRIVDRGRIGNALYAISGSTFKGARVVMLDRIKYIGDMALEDEPKDAPQPPGGDDEARPPIPVDEPEREPAEA